MWKRSVAAVALCGGLWASGLWAQRESLPPGPMQVSARVACLFCHDAGIIVQQQLDRRGWGKVLDKMIGWGAPVAAEDREAMIDYFAQHFGPRVREPANAKLAAGRGAEKVRAACLSCHDAGIIVQQQLDRRGWAGTLDKMVGWGAAVRPEDREAILDYLATNYPAPTKATKQQK
ncbi:MAG: hypothetical protein ACE5MH_02260 [Terriglobia bacterium]